MPRSVDAHGRICTKFGKAVEAAEVISCTKFLVIGQGVWILCVGGGQKLPSPIDKASRR